MFLLLGLRIVTSLGIIICDRKRSSSNQNEFTWVPDLVENRDVLYIVSLYPISRYSLARIYLLNWEQPVRFWHGIFYTRSLRELYAYFLWFEYSMSVLIWILCFRFSNLNTPFSVFWHEYFALGFLFWILYFRFSDLYTPYSFFLIEYSVFGFLNWILRFRFYDLNTRYLFPDLNTLLSIFKMDIRCSLCAFLLSIMYSFCYRRKFCSY